MKFLVLGANGMAGHIIAIYLKEQGHCVKAFVRKPFPYMEEIRGEIADLSYLKAVIEGEKFDAVVNCVGVLNQDAEKNKHQAVFLNSYLPHYLSHLTAKTTTRIIHLSTDCVFSGMTGNYDESAFRDGRTFYARSKALGELENEKDLTFRTSIVGPDMRKEGSGLFNWFMKQDDSIKGFTKAVWTGITTLTLAQAIEKATQDHLFGLYNLVNNEPISKLELLELFNTFFRDGSVGIQPCEEIKHNKSLVDTRGNFDFQVPTYKTMVKEMKAWVYSHKALYSHYFPGERLLGE